MEYDRLTPYKVRELIKNGQIRGQTSGMCPGFAQGNIVIVPERYAADFKQFAVNNPRACPILEVLEPGNPVSRILASGADIRVALPKYRLFEKGIFSREVYEIASIWQDDFVTFVLGCSFTFESALIEAGIRMKHIEMKRNVAMYITNIETKPSGRFRGPLVVSMRPIRNEDVEKAVMITSLYPEVHGSPIHIGNPAAIGITSINEPDFGDPVPIDSGETPVFWACGVTPQMALVNAGVEIAITHSPGHMLITDIKNTELGGV